MPTVITLDAPPYLLGVGMDTLSVPELRRMVRRMVRDEVRYILRERPPQIGFLAKPYEVEQYDGEEYGSKNRKGK